jgi:RNA polymerase sigma factor (sigma-70 family)
MCHCLLVENLQMPGRQNFREFRIPPPIAGGNQAQTAHRVESVADDNFEELLSSAVSGDERAAAMLVERYGKHVQRAVRRILPGRLRSLYDSEDFGQAVWKSFFADPDMVARFANPAALIAYLATVARNKVIDESRRRFGTKKHDLRRVEQVAWDSSLAPADTRNPTPSEVVSADDMVSKLLESTSGRQREILQLRLSGRSSHEIASILGLHERAVRRAIAKLADLVEK